MVYIKLGPAKQYVDNLIHSILYNNCVDIAKKLGQETPRYSGSEWANARYIFEDKMLKVDFEIYAMADEELRVSYNGKSVLLLDEICNTPPKLGNPVVKVSKFKKFEVKTFEPGAWLKRIDKLHGTIHK